jgi:glycosyltransferase involved in cell wall biosynthesis
MDRNRDCAAVIPCFNEAGHLRRLVAEVKEHVSHVIVVDDGSWDETSGQAQAAGADVVRLKKNSGKGVALRCGWWQARELGFKWVLMLDGDGQHSADDIPKFFRGAEAGGAKLVVGNRMDDTRRMPLVRRWANRWMSRRISQMAGVVLPDSQCGFRLAHLETLLNLQIRANRFEVESAMLIAFVAAGVRVKFVPVQTIYRSQASHINPVADSWRWLRWRRDQGVSRRAFARLQHDPRATVQPDPGVRNPGAGGQVPPLAPVKAALH